MNTTPTIICLGRNGDILNALPLARHLASQGKPNFMVSAEYASALDAVSYVTPVVWHRRFEDLLGAKAAAEALGGPVHIPQVYGLGYAIPDGIKCESFCEEAYRVAGFHTEFLQGAYDKIEIDERVITHWDEKKLVDAVLKTGVDKPIVLVNVTGGHSSPFPGGKDLMETLVKRYGETTHIIDLSAIRSRNITDLLALYEHADLLITTDTATLHLAGATDDLPYMALIADKPSKWHGAYTRGNCILRARYSDYPNWKSAIVELVKFVISPPKSPYRLVHAYHVPPFIHPEISRRNRVAMHTWRTFDAVGGFTNRLPFPMSLDKFKRTFECAEGRKIPFIKDMIDAAVDYAGRENDCIMLCNSDTCLSLDAWSKMVPLIQKHGGFCGSRRDFPRLDEQLKANEVPRGTDYTGTDLFVFKPDWWKKNREAFPDMVLSAEAWDCVLRETMLRDGFPLVKDLCYHERHYTRWSDPKYRYTLPMQIHNLKLAREVMPTINPNWKPGMFGIK